MMLRETRTGRITVKPYINALGEREDMVWADPIRGDSRKSILDR